MPCPSFLRRLRSPVRPLGLHGGPRRSWTPVLVASGILLGAMVGSGAVEVAGANSSSTTYYGCLSAHGTLFRVGTAPASCSGRSTTISWNATGPRGGRAAGTVRGPGGGRAGRAAGAGRGRP